MSRKVYLNLKKKLNSYLRTLSNLDHILPFESENLPIKWVLIAVKDCFENKILDSLSFKVQKFEEFGHNGYLVHQEN